MIGKLSGYWGAQEAKGEENQILNLCLDVQDKWDEDGVSGLEVCIITTLQSRPHLTSTTDAIGEGRSYIFPMNLIVKWVASSRLNTIRYVIRFPTLP